MAAFNLLDDEDSQPAFKTGARLQKEQIQKLMASNAGIAGGRTPQEKRNRSLGAMLGSAIAGKALAGDPGIAAGDILAAQEKPPASAAELAKFQQDLFDAGLTEDAMGLTKQISALSASEKALKEGSGGDAAKFTITDADRKRVQNNLVMRTGNEDSVLGQTLAPFLGDDVDPYQQVQLNYVADAVAEKSAGIQARLREMDYNVDETLVDEMILDELESSGAATPESGMLWWQEDGKVDRKLVLKSMANTEANIMARFTGEGKPVVPAEPQTTTKMEQSAQPARMEQAIQEVMAADMPQEAKIAKVKELAAAQRNAKVEVPPGATDLSQIKPDSTAFSQQLNKLGTNPYAVDTKSDLEVKTGDLVERRKQLLDGIKSGEFKANDPWTQKMLKELFKQ